MAPHLLGSEEGFRDRLADAGLTFLADNTGFAIGNATGGFDQAFDYAGHGDYCVIADDPRLVVCGLELRSGPGRRSDRCHAELGPFGRAGLADPSTSPIDAFLRFGFGGNVPGQVRRDDTFGVGWYSASTSPEIGTLITVQFGPVGDGQGIECFYNYAVRPAVRITPDPQYVVPTLRLAEPALIGGGRALVSFCAEQFLDIRNRLQGMRRALGYGFLRGTPAPSIGPAPGRG